MQYCLWRAAASTYWRSDRKARLSRVLLLIWGSPCCRNSDTAESSGREQVGEGHKENTGEQVRTIAPRCYTGHQRVVPRELEVPFPLCSSLSEETKLNIWKDTGSIHSFIHSFL